MWNLRKKTIQGVLLKENYKPQVTNNNSITTPLSTRFVAFVFVLQYFCFLCVCV